MPDNLRLTKPTAAHRRHWPKGTLLVGDKVVVAGGIGTITAIAAGLASVVLDAGGRWIGAVALLHQAPSWPT